MYGIECVAWFDMVWWLHNLDGWSRHPVGPGRVFWPRELGSNEQNSVVVDGFWNHFQQLSRQYPHLLCMLFPIISYVYILDIISLFLCTDNAMPFLLWKQNKHHHCHLSLLAQAFANRVLYRTIFSQRWRTKRHMHACELGGPCVQCHWIVVFSLFII